MVYLSKLGKVGKRKRDEKRAIKEAWFEEFGYKEEDRWWHRCQSCRAKLCLNACDYSHKISAGTGGDVGGTVSYGNGIASCRSCHSWLETSPDASGARKFLIQDKASFENDLVVQWPKELLRSLQAWKTKNGWL